MTVGVARQHAGITGQGTAMVTGAISAGVPFGWAAGDEVYGRSSNLRARPVKRANYTASEEDRLRRPGACVRRWPTVSGGPYTIGNPAQLPPGDSGSAEPAGVSPGKERLSPEARRG